MTSSGQVTTPEAMPAAAPQAALTVELGRAAHLRARLEYGELQFASCIGGSRLGEIAELGAYRSLALSGDGGGAGSSADIAGAGHGK